MLKSAVFILSLALLSEVQTPPSFEVAVMKRNGLGFNGNPFADPTAGPSIFTAIKTT